MPYILPDTWEQQIQPAAYGRIRLDILVTTDDVQIAQAVHQYPRRNGADLQPMGTGPRSTRCAVIFFDRIGDADDPLGTDDHLSRFAIFWNTITQAAEADDFAHPLFGTYRALPTELSVHAEATERNVVVVEVTFVEDSTAPATIPIPDTAPFQVSNAQLERLATEYDTAVAALALPADSPAVGLGAECVSTVTAWEATDDVTIRQVNGDLSRLSDSIADALRDIDYGGDLDRVPLFRTTVRLHAMVRKAAEAFRRRAPQIIELTVAETTSLWELVVRLYGAQSAQQRYEEILELNDIADPGRLLSGTRLLRPQDNPVGNTQLWGVRG